MVILRNSWIYQSKFTQEVVAFNINWLITSRQDEIIREVSVQMEKKMPEDGAPGALQLPNSQKKV